MGRLAQKFPYPFAAQVAALEREVREQTQWCEDDADLARMRGWVSGIADDLRHLASSLELPPVAEEVR